MPVKKGKKIIKKKKQKVNRNIRTAAFGPVMWNTMIFVALGAPDKIPKKERSYYKTFFNNMKNIIPCSLCRDSYKQFISLKGKAPITDKVLSTRKNLTMFVFRLKNLVNKKIGCKQISNKEMERKYKYYNQFRARTCSPKLNTGCTIAENQNKIPLKTKVVTIKDYKALKPKQRKLLKYRFGKHK